MSSKRIPTGLLGERPTGLKWSSAEIYPKEKLFQRVFPLIRASAENRLLPRFGRIPRKETSLGEDFTEAISSDA